MPLLPPSKADTAEAALAQLYQRRAAVDQLIRSLLQYNRVQALRRPPAATVHILRASVRRLAS